MHRRNGSGIWCRQSCLRRGTCPVRSRQGKVRRGKGSLWAGKGRIRSGQGRVRKIQSSVWQGSCAVSNRCHLAASHQRWCAPVATGQRQRGEQELPHVWYNVWHRLQLFPAGGLSCRLWGRPRVAQRAGQHTGRDAQGAARRPPVLRQVWAPPALFPHHCKILIDTRL